MSESIETLVSEDVPSFQPPSQDVPVDRRGPTPKQLSDRRAFDEIKKWVDLATTNIDDSNAESCRARGEDALDFLYHDKGQDAFIPILHRLIDLETEAPRELATFYVCPAWPSLKALNDEYLGPERADDFHAELAEIAEGIFSELNLLYFSKESDGSEGIMEFAEGDEDRMRVLIDRYQSAGADLLDNFMKAEIESIKLEIQYLSLQIEAGQLGPEDEQAAKDRMKLLSDRYESLFEFLPEVRTRFLVAFGYADWEMPATKGLVEESALEKLPPLEARAAVRKAKIDVIASPAFGSVLAAEAANATAIRRMLSPRGEKGQNRTTAIYRFNPAYNLKDMASARTRAIAFGSRLVEKYGEELPDLANMNLIFESRPQATMYLLKAHFINFLRKCVRGHERSENPYSDEIADDIWQFYLLLEDYRKTVNVFDLVKNNRTPNFESYVQRVSGIFDLEDQLCEATELDELRRIAARLDDEMRRGLKSEDGVELVTPYGRIAAMVNGSSGEDVESIWGDLRGLGAENVATVEWNMSKVFDILDSVVMFMDLDASDLSDFSKHIVQEWRARLKESVGEGVHRDRLENMWYYATVHAETGQYFISELFEKVLKPAGMDMWVLDLLMRGSDDVTEDIKTKRFGHYRDLYKRLEALEQGGDEFITFGEKKEGAEDLESVAQATRCRVMRVVHDVNLLEILEEQTQAKLEALNGGGDTVEKARDHALRCVTRILHRANSLAEDALVRAKDAEQTGQVLPIEVVRLSDIWRDIQSQYVAAV